MADEDAAAPNIFARLMAKATSGTAKKKNAPVNKNLLSNQLAANLDLDFFGQSFAKFAGSDGIMDAQEFENYSKKANLSRKQAAHLWEVLDKDNSGEVSMEEFEEALTNFQRARAWLRYCPDCIYQNTCAYCMETNANCTNCTENAFCAACWADHPSRHREVEGGDGDDAQAAAAKAALSTADQVRTQLIIRPLNWAYTSPVMAWLPVEQKAVLREALRAQQQAVADSQERQRREEEAALAMR